MLHVKKVAELARLEIGDTLSEKIEGQLQSILDHFELLSEVPTEGVDPLVTPIEVSQYLRPDEVKAWERADSEATSNASESMGNLFKVPPVV